MQSIFQSYTQPLRRMVMEAGEMAQQLRELAKLPEDLSSIHRIHMAAHNHLQLKSRRADALFWPLWAPGIQVVQT